MARYRSTTSLRVVGAAVQTVVTRFLQATQADDMAEAFEALANEMILAGLSLSHIDLAGGGDGHTFVLHTQWAKKLGENVVFVDGGAPSIIRLFFYQAAQASALAAARARVQSLIAARFLEPGGVETVIEVDTYLAGAQMGTRYMGAVMTSITVPG